MFGSLRKICFRIALKVLHCTASLDCLPIVSGEWDYSNIGSAVYWCYSGGGSYNRLQSGLA